MAKAEELLRWLEENGCACEQFEHPPAFTMEDMQRYGMDARGLVAKNLFLRDAKGRRHFLLVVCGDKAVDLRALGESLGAKLGFASAERLAKYLQLEKGAVTPLGMYYDKDRAVELLLDRDLAGHRLIGVHPGENTSTVFLPFDDLAKLLKNTGKCCKIIDVPQKGPGGEA